MKNNWIIYRLGFINPLINYYSLKLNFVSLITKVTLSKNGINLINRHMANSSQLSEKGKYQLCTETNINEPK